MRLLYLHILVLFFAGCKDDEVEPTDSTPKEHEQHSTGFYFTGNWCGPCGYYSKPAIEKAEDKYGNDFIWISCQMSGSGNTDPFSNSDASDLHSMFNTTGYPSIVVGANGEPFQSFSGGADFQSRLDTCIQSDLNLPAKALVNLDYSSTTDSIYITAVTTYKEGLAGDLSIAAYLIENKLYDRQYITGSGWQNNSRFDHVLRKTLSSTPIGDTLPSGQKIVGQMDTLYFKTDIRPAWNINNIQIVAVLWRQDQNGRTILNSSIK